MRTYFLLFTIMLAIRIPSYAQVSGATRKEAVVLKMDINVPPKQWPGDLVDFRVAAARTDKSQPISVLFTRYGAASIRLYEDSVYFNHRYDEGFMNLAINNNVKTGSNDEPITVDLSKLGDGEYVAIYSTGTRHEAIKISLTSD